MTTSVKRACDACHRRKVKCDGINPCRNCSSAQLACTYHAIPQKKGPKGSRAKVISELRETQRQSTLSSKVANRLHGVSSPPCSPTLAPTPGLLTGDMIKDCIEFFFANMYPHLPILHRGRLEQQALSADQNVDTYCLLSSLCAFMMIQPGMGIPGGDPLGLDNLPGANIVSGNLLLEETLKVRKSYDHLESPTMNSLVTSFFLFGCYFGMDLHNKAWFHLREATTLAHILNMQMEETYLQFDTVEASRRRRLYWLLFVTERAYALQRHRPLSLQATITLPTEQDDPSDTQSQQLHGFIHLVNLFRPFDDQFVAMWNKTRNDYTPAYLSALQKQLSEALPTYLNSTENQAVDLRTSQQWLRTMVWQLSTQNGFLSPGHDDPSMTFQYPVEIARDLVGMTSQFSQHSMEVHGIGLIEKLFDVACSLTDVLSLLPANPQPFELGPPDYLQQLMSLLSVLRNGDSRFLPLLLAKVHDVLPTLVNPMLQTVPETPANICAEIDIFGGYPPMTMSVPSNYANLTSTSDSDFKLASQAEFKLESPTGLRLDEISSPNENSTPSFTNPPIIPTSMEYPGLNPYDNSFNLHNTHDPHGPHFPHHLPSSMGNFGQTIDSRQRDFKTEFDGNLGLLPSQLRRPPLRQSTSLAYTAGMQQHGMHRNIPEQYHMLQRASSHGEGLEMGGMGDGIRFR